MTSDFHRLSKIVAGEEGDKKEEKSFSEDILKFLSENEEYDEDSLIEWSKENGYDFEDVETEIYENARRFSKIITGGKFRESGKSEDDFDEDQVRKGIKVEMEHTDDEGVAKHIALDHLSEMEDYYDKLAKMEGKGD